MTYNIHAFISRGAFEIDGEVRDGVVTANCHDDGEVEIVLRTLGGTADIQVVLDEQDLASVNALLRQQAAIEEEDEEEDDDQAA